MMLKVLIISAIILALSMIALAFKFFNANRTPLCNNSDVADDNQDSICGVCGIDDAEDCTRVN